MGVALSSDDAFLALRGLRTLAVRLERHTQSALTIARWLRERPEVQEVIFPALPGSRGHELWKRDFSGACGLFGVILKPVAKARVDALLDGLRLFRMGWSWGGFESLIIPANVERAKRTIRWEAGGPYLRLHVGLESVDDLIADLEAGFARLRG
jgi:cystathionine beta-lyase